MAAASGTRYGRRIIATASLAVARPPGVVFRPIERIGGDTGYYAYDFLWRWRGMLDQALGGPGLKRGRPAAGALRVGDKLDYWNVAEFEPGTRLRLECEMKLPGRGWLEFEVTGSGSQSVVRQTTAFDPRGFLGLLYWYGMYPLHKVVFDAMLRAIAAAAMREPGAGQI